MHCFCDLDCAALLEYPVSLWFWATSFIQLTQQKSIQRWTNVEFYLNIKTGPSTL